MGYSAYIALGSSLGDRQRNIRRAIELLRELGQIRAVSPLIEYAAVDSPPDSPPFLNAAAELDTALSAEKLLEKLLEIERHMGRVRSVKNAPRVIDLDLLLYDQLQIDQPNLKLPHPRMHERRFVLEPLAAIAPEINHPVLNKSIYQLFSELK